MQPVHTLKTIALAAAVISTSAFAALDIGDKAPDFSTNAAIAGRTFKFSLAESLAKGPVVLYFFPAAFTDGCSIEANSFAEAITRYEALGATVVGVSGDDIETLSRFSVKACSGKFAVASDESKTIMKSFDAVMPTMPNFANRVSYVIAPNGSVVYSYMSLNPDKHVDRTLTALRDWKSQARKP